MTGVQDECDQRGWSPGVSAREAQGRTCVLDGVDAGEAAARGDRWERGTRSLRARDGGVCTAGRETASVRRAGGETKERRTRRGGAGEAGALSAGVAWPTCDGGEEISSLRIACERKL
ncbi:hypothetical protein L226DRAFT_71703 [Lentinus tigrinus ALCF2SS1-7]|uniref:uncharacterized protein n=1 Tax=Lentinus tigrinus ALCF2SS1-7 TaxID=1328758 RepID=UPI001165C9A2|nr:hypothetical protein L226DRAFT_71703 [Lentinus tigrinus ALCF2SS1-7]